MTYTVIEATSQAQREAFKQTADYAAICANATITEGITLGVEVDADVIGDIYWILVEDDRDEDHATFRINDEGVAVFSAGGVEI